jgi:hypothetical protein
MHYKKKHILRRNTEYLDEINLNMLLFSENNMII